jgi:Phasin protein
MPAAQTQTRALEATGAPQTRADTVATVTGNGAELAQIVAEQIARAAQTVVQQADQSLDLALQLTGTALSNSQAVQSALTEQAQQAVQRTFDALTQASQVRCPIALLDLLSGYLTENLKAVLATHVRLAEIAADVAHQAAGKLQHRAA